MSNIASDNLHQLVKSLTKPEKRYFKVFSSRHVLGDNNNYLIIFDAIDKQTEYDEAKLLKKFKGELFTNRFSIAKSRLYTNIMKSLDSFHSNSSIDAQLQRQLHGVEILYHKSLYEQSMKQLSSARKVAQRYEKFTILADISKWEKRILERDNYEELKGEKQLTEILRVDREILQTIQSYNELWFVKSKIFTHLYLQGKVRNEDELNGLKKIIDEAAGKLEGKQSSTENTYILNHLRSAYHFSLGQYKECYPFIMDNLKLIDKKPHLFKEEPNIYMSVLTNSIYVGMRLGKWNEALKNVEKLRQLPKKLELQKSEDLDIRIFTLAKSTELTLYAQSGEFEKGHDLIPSIEAGLFKYEGKISSVRKAHFYFNIAVVHFGLEHFHESLKWINKLLNHVEIDKTRDIHCMAQILNMVIHLELGNKDLLPYTLRSTQRFLDTRKKVYKFENVMLDFVNEMLKKRQPKTEVELYSILVDSLSALRKDTFECTVFEYFDFLAWAKSKSCDKKYRVVLAA